MVWYEGSTVSSATRCYLHADHQGSIVATSNAAGTKLDIGTYDAYGVTNAPSTWRFQYTGQSRAEEVTRQTSSVRRRQSLGGYVCNIRYDKAYINDCVEPLPGWIGLVDWITANICIDVRSSSDAYESAKAQH